MSTLAMFPGQGSQYLGMGKDLLNEFPYTAVLFEEAEDAISINLRKVCFEGPASELNLTALTQPCILTISFAYWRVLAEEIGFNANYFAGHSLGEYSALVASGRLQFSDALRLVRLRGLAMQKAVPEGKGAMAAVMNIDSTELIQMCEQTSHPQSIVAIANYNSEKQVVVAGHSDALNRLTQSLKEKRARVVPLPVSAPFHSQLMTPAKKEMEPHLLGMVLHQQSSYVIPNVSGKATRDYEQGILIEQIDHPVLWVQSMKEADLHGVSRYVEVGPGSVLCGLLKRISLGNSYESFSTDKIRQALTDLAS